MTKDIDTIHISSVHDNIDKDSPIESDSLKLSKLPRVSTLQDDYFHVGFISRTISQFRALFMKNITITFYQWKSNLFNFCLTLILLLLVLALKLILGFAIGDALKFPGKDNFPIEKFSPWAAIQTSLTNSGSGGIVTTSTLGKRGPNPTFLLSVQDPTYSSFFGYRYENGTSDGLFAKIPTLNLTTGVFAPSFIPVPNKLQGNLLMDQAFSKLSEKPFPYSGAFHIKNWNSNNLEYTVQYDNKSKTHTCNRIVNNLGSCGGFMPTFMMDYVNNFYILNQTNNNVGVVSKAIHMPYKSETVEFDIVSWVSAFIFPMVLSIMLPSFAYLIVQDKVTKVREFSKLMGLPNWIYYTTTFIINYSIYLLAALEFAIFSAIADFPFIRKNNWIISVLTLLLWGINLVSFSFLLSSVLNSTLVASIAGYLFVLFGPLAGVILEAFIIKPGELAYKPILLVFPFPITHVLMAHANLCEKNNCPGYGEIFGNNDFLFGFIFMIVDSIIYFLLAIYLDAVWPRTYGVRKNPLFCILGCFSFIRKKYEVSKIKKKSKNVEYELEDQKKLEDETIQKNGDAFINMSTDYKDEAVKEEKAKVLSGEYTINNSTILFHKLKKNFGKKRVVKGLTFAVGVNGQGECLGYLGANGAGKSTSINILTGMIAPSSGTAYLNGYDIRYEIDKVYRSIGLCPQFDIYYPVLSCYEHMLFYARIKGVPFNKEKQHVKEILEQVGLWTRTNAKTGHVEKLYKRKAGALSGGMRRRLSIAIALVGNPKIVFLDEPTTGLDSSTKRVLWECLLKAKKNRTILLVSHDLEECEVLSDRISIMRSGKLYTIGTSLELKNKFGKGYKIQINYDMKDHDRAIKYVMDNVQGARITYDFSGTTHFEVPRVGFSVGDTFIKFENEKTPNGIREFSVNQVTLEQVFLNIVEEA